MNHRRTVYTVYTLEQIESRSNSISINCAVQIKSIYCPNYHRDKKDDNWLQTVLHSERLYSVALYYVAIIM